MSNNYVIASERERGKDVYFQKIRRITGYLTGDLTTWNDAKRKECSDRVKHNGLAKMA